jgi:hypothetical protein
MISMIYGSKGIREPSYHKLRKYDYDPNAAILPEKYSQESGDDRQMKNEQRT